MLRRRLSPTVISLVAVLCVLASSSVAAVGPAASARTGFRVLEGKSAATFRLPADVRLVRTWRDERRDLTYERYQQFAQPLDVMVEGAQLTVVRRGAGNVLVTGAHYPSVAVTNRVVLDGKAAISRALADKTLALVGDGAQSAVGDLQHRTQLRLDPETGRLFQRVDSGASGVYIVHEIDAQTGVVLDAWDEIDHAQPGMGTGVRGDRKSLLGGTGSGDDLTRRVSDVWRMQSTDGRMSTLDAKRDSWYRSGLLVLGDNVKAGWANDNDWAAAYQGPAVDAQYYGRLTDNDYLARGFDFVTTPCVASDGSPTAPPLGPLRYVVHYDETPGDGFGYENAFWDGYNRYLVFGDGDGLTTGGFSGSQDVVSHEITHAVTQCRAPLTYKNESGALNEAISDIMATAMEWQLNEPTSSNCRRQSGQASCPDWWIGEDLILGGSTFGFRSHADPESAGQPGHWQDRYTAPFDNGGVHYNSGIANHAFYLMANGGRNARCTGALDVDADCDVVVPPIPLTDATEIMFSAWGMLTTGANFCEAHDNTVAAAGLLFPDSKLHQAAAELAWAAVGRGKANCRPGTGIQINPRSLAIAPGTVGSLSVDINEALVSVPLPATATVNGTSIDITVPAEMADGVYPIVVADSGDTQQAYAAFVIDATAPTVSVISGLLPSTGQISADGAFPLRVTWAAADSASGVANALLEATTQSSPGVTDWISVSSSPGTSDALVDGGSYWFRASATDAVGNTATSAASGPWTIGRLQEGSASYKGAWSALPASQNWGSVRYATASGATAKFAFNGTDVAWISSRGPNRGKAKVLVDGVLIAKVDLYASTASVRRIALTVTGLSAGPHTLKVIVSGTSGRPRVDIDGFVVLSQPSP